MPIANGRRQRRWWSGMTLSLMALALALASGACFGGDDDFLGDEGTTTPTATFTRTPGPTATGTPTGTGTPAATVSPTGTATPSVSITQVEPFQITVTEAVNIRATPSTNADVVGTIFAAETRQVIGEARGEEAQAGEGNLWYALEGGGFVYAPFVQRA